ncbi:MAG: hypothetical protein NWQ32_06380, partial [Paracoccaceae bacterium]|nr:hypothetical protein [Paracoccaceae bacterium]
MTLDDLATLIAARADAEQAEAPGKNARGQLTQRQPTVAHRCLGLQNRTSFEERVKRASQLQQ